ncbi:MAG TPA: TetR/AcrR family transcriptional regulator C-terminal domain-containing protein [Polyangiaceae bacterium]|nr:TetR/AcrR family transcriptional regulator C-terminal domain-containing protein [Polyangiaceae bacterium]
MKQNTASQRVVAELRARIRTGKLRPGERVSSARQIMSEWGVALATASKVLAQLRRDGLVRVLPGRGTMVSGERGPDLSTEKIVATAIAIADDEGIAALSMRGVATELGVPTMSLYRHVPSKETLLTRMVEAVFLEEPMPVAEGREWRVSLEAIARLEWRIYTRHPWLAHALSMTRPEALENGMRHTEAVVAALVTSGLDGATTLRTGVSFMAFIMGMARAIEAERMAERDTGLESGEWMTANESLFAPLMPRFPTLARLTAGPDIDMGLDALFACALSLFLDGLAERVRKGGEGAGGRRRARSSS